MPLIETIVRRTCRRTGTHRDVPFDAAVSEIVVWLAELGYHREADAEHVGAELQEHPIQSDLFFYECR